MSGMEVKVVCRPDPPASEGTGDGYTGESEGESI